MVGAFSYLWITKRDLAVAQKEHNLPQHKLVTESPTRWGSCQKMVQRVLEQENASAQVLSSAQKTRHLGPTYTDIDLLESINQILTPLLEFTDALSGESYVSLSYLKPVLHLFNTEVMKPDGETELTQTIKTIVMNYLNEKYDDLATDDLLDIASLVDLRFKTSKRRRWAT